ncbi:MAG: DUF2007 domain-containing protein [Bacteroidales bacterium]|nr:DUF2007 domain-containing protein [Bacteroidales bacterium]
MVPLVEKLSIEGSEPIGEKSPPEEPKPAITSECIKFKNIKKSTDMGDIAIIQSILDDHRIMYSIYNDYLASPFGGPDQYRIMVSKEQAQEARELLKDFL